MFRKGEKIGVVKLKNAYDRYVLEVLRAELEQVDQPRTSGRRKPAKYRIRRHLPDKAEYLRLKTKRYTTTVDSLVGDAYGEVECLADEMRSWHDNMENLQESDTGQRVGEAADALENVCAEGVPDDFKELPVLYLPPLKIGSRSSRAAEAGAMLNAAAECTTECTEGTEEERREFSDMLTEHADELGEVDCPGMYG